MFSSIGRNGVAGAGEVEVVLSGCGHVVGVDEDKALAIPCARKVLQADDEQIPVLPKNTYNPQDCPICKDSAILDFGWQTLSRQALGAKHASHS